ncbi:hypothetical protein GWK47_053563 [Chionoecetes opilio]|uniref:Uncharacterized protein n=1 Tax=Chionoecetes opilio TaxID=41210 RepID=A0A8J4Y6X9_CHIOP|nr:hypothetical protein GWK47_053563 [Chionoecetes opilio]
MVPMVQTCILEATNPDRIYGNAPQQLCHYTTILLFLPLVPKIPLNPCRIILPDLCQSREPINFEIHQERKMAIKNDVSIEVQRKCCRETNCETCIVLPVLDFDMDI